MPLCCLQKLLTAFIFLFTLQVVASSFTPPSNEVDANPNSVWSKIKEITGFFLEKCLFSKNAAKHQDVNKALILKDCLKRRGLRALDGALSRDVIRVTDNIVFVKWRNETNSSERSRNWSTTRSLKETDTYRELIRKIVQFLRTRIVKIGFKGLPLLPTQSEARHRHKHNSFGQILLFGLVAAGLIIIPLGFQFLAVLGGKALLLAKLALLLTSIQGLKKIATSDVNYGLYSTDHVHDQQDHHFHAGPWHYDRQWHHNISPYPMTYYASPHEAPSVDHYFPVSPSDLTYPNLHPRLEDHVNTHQ